MLPDPTGHEAAGRRALQPGGTCTLALRALADWRAAGGGPHGARASPGASWTPVSTVLDGPGTVVWGNAAHGPQVPGRQTAHADARGLATRLRSGVLQARCMFFAGQRALRARTRSRLTRGQ